MFAYTNTQNPLTIYSELWFSSPCSTHLPFLPETVCSCTKKYDIRFCSDFCSMLRSPTDYSGSNRTLLFECSQEIRERLANTTVPGLCTFNKTGMQKSVHTSGSCLKQICLRRGLKEIRSYYIHFKFPLPRQIHFHTLHLKKYMFTNSTLASQQDFSMFTIGLFPPFWEIRKGTSVPWWYCSIVMQNMVASKINHYCCIFNAII